MSVLAGYSFIALIAARYGTGSGSDRVTGARSLPLPVPYQGAPSGTSNWKSLLDRLPQLSRPPLSAPDRLL